MTNEEIERAVSAIATEIRTAGYGAAFGAGEQFAAREIVRLVSQAYEEAMVTIKGLAIGPAVSDADTFRYNCALSDAERRVRALKDSLALEPAPPTSPPLPSAPASPPVNQ